MSPPSHPKGIDAVFYIKFSINSLLNAWIGQGNEARHVVIAHRYKMPRLEILRAMIASGRIQD
uniref:Transcriptional regulator n=1 Tax=Heterorhabditis bacteriophora TaxID=37862 RepID=A0A1I7X3D9_HETBA